MSGNYDLPIERSQGTVQRAAAWLRTFWAGFDARAASRREDRALQEQWLPGYAVRRDFAEHHFLDYFTADHSRAQRRAALLRRWHGLPVLATPALITVVATNRAEVREHQIQPQFCTSRQCSKEAVGAASGRPHAGERSAGA